MAATSSLPEHHGGLFHGTFFHEKWKVGLVTNNLTGAQMQAHTPACCDKWHQKNNCVAQLQQEQGSLPHPWKADRRLGIKKNLTITSSFHANTATCCL